MRWFVLLATGCTIGGGLQGDQGFGVGDKESDNSSPPTDMTATDAAEVCPAVGFEGSCEADVGTGSELSATGGVGVVDVIHVGMDMPDCRSWWADPAFAGNRTIDVAYRPAVDDDTGAPCADECGWTFSYRLEGLAAGKWMVRAGGDEVVVTVR